MKKAAVLTPEEDARLVKAAEMAGMTFRMPGIEFSRKVDIFFIQQPTDRDFEYKIQHLISRFIDDYIATCKEHLGEDNVLTADEIRNLQLNGVPLMELLAD